MELIEFQPEHFGDLIKSVRSPEFLLQWGGPTFQFPLTVGQLKLYKESKGQYVFTVIEQDKFAGHISIRHDERNEGARIGKVLVQEEMRGQGLGEQIVRKACEFAFNELKCHKVSLGVFEFNKSAIRSYEKVGFQIEGILRDARKSGENYWTLVEMGLLKSEFN